MRLLDGLLPGKNLGAASHDAQPKTPWYAVSARTYRPGQPSLRSRLAVIGLFPLIGVVYGLAMLVPAWRGYAKGHEAFQTFEPRQRYMRTLEPRVGARATGLPTPCPAFASKTSDAIWLTMVRSSEPSSIHGISGEPGKTHDMVLPVTAPSFGDAWLQAITSGGHVYFPVPLTSRWLLWEERTEDGSSKAQDKNKRVNYVVADAETKTLLCGGTVLTDSIYSSDLTTALVEAARGRP